MAVKKPKINIPFWLWSVKEKILCSSNMKCVIMSNLFDGFYVYLEQKKTLGDVGVCRFLDDRLRRKDSFAPNYCQIDFWCVMSKKVETLTTPEWNLLFQAVVRTLENPQEIKREAPWKNCWERRYFSMDVTSDSFTFSTIFFKCFKNSKLFL